MLKLATALVLPSLLLLTACTGGGCCPPRCARSMRPTPRTVRPRPAEVPMRTHALYDGTTGAPTTLEAFLAAHDDADVVFFGELHGHPVGAEYERRVLEGLAAGPRPVALAMEFFERDTQDALDRYLAGDLDAETFRKDTKRNAEYDATHGPLVEWARAHGAPAIAANAPRRLVTDYRKSETDYATWREGLPEEDQPLVATGTSVIQDAYWERFEKLMGQRAEGFFRSQSLWDDTMAESMARHRDEHPDSRVLMVVGAFHVTGGLGTVTKYLQRRPDDKVALLVMDTATDPGLAFTPADRDQGDAVLKVRPQERPKP